MYVPFSTSLEKLFVRIKQLKAVILQGSALLTPLERWRQLALIKLLYYFLQFNLL